MSANGIERRPCHGESIGPNDCNRPYAGPHPPLIPALNDIAQETAAASFGTASRRAYCDHLSATDKAQAR